MATHRLKCVKSDECFFRNPQESLIHLVSNYLAIKLEWWTGLRPLLPRLHDLSDRFLQALGDIPSGVVRLHLAKVAVVADVVADAVLIDVGVLLFLAGEFLGNRKGLKDGAGVLLPSPEIVDFGDARCLDEGGHEAGDIKGVDVVADLFPLVAEDAVFFPLEVALHKVAEEAVKLHAGVVGTGETAPAQRAGGHAEVASIFLDHDVSSYLGGSEEGVLTLVDGEVFGDAVSVGWICVVPASLKLRQGDGIGPVAVDLVRRHVDEGGLRASLAGCLEHVEGADGVRIKVVEGDSGRAVVAGLGGGVDDGIGLDLGNQVDDSLTVSDVQFVVDKALIS